MANCKRNSELRLVRSHAQNGFPGREERVHGQVGKLLGSEVAVELSEVHTDFAAVVNDVLRSLHDLYTDYYDQESR